MYMYVFYILGVSVQYNNNIPIIYTVIMRTSAYDDVFIV